jgi:hypothetical protein
MTLSLIASLEDVEDILKTKEAGNCTNSNESRYNKAYQLFQKWYQYETAVFSVFVEGNHWAVEHNVLILIHFNIKS